jgi:hypothetical protein
MVENPTAACNGKQIEAWLMPRASTMLKYDRHLSRMDTFAFKKTKPGAGWGSGFIEISILQIKISPFSVKSVHPSVNLPLPIPLRMDLKSGWVG